MDIEEVGQDKYIMWSNQFGYTASTRVKVIMCIIAPRGMMFLYQPEPIRKYTIETQCQAIKAFMAQHKED